MEDDAPELTDDQIQALLNGADDRLRALLGIVALAGQTPGQALSVLRQDVRLDSDPPCFDVRQAYHASHDEIPRSIKADTQLGEYLGDHLQNTSHLTDGAPLFAAHDGRPLTTRWAQRELEVLRKKLGLDPFKLRDLRRAAIRRMDEGGMPQRQMQKQLGLADHSFFRSVYPSTSPRQRKSAARPKVSLGRPRQTERDAELIRMMQQRDANYSTVADEYNRLHPPKRGKKELTPDAVRKVIKPSKKKREAQS